MTVRILDVTAQQYHADPCYRPSLSSSVAKVLVTQSEAHAYAAHPKLGGRAHHRRSKTLDRGTIIHRMVLGAGTDLVEVEFDNYRTKKAQEARDAAIEAGNVPVLPKEMRAYRNAAAAITENLAALGFEFTGKSELALSWEEEVPFHDTAQVLCRAMFDHVFVERAVVWDLKTIESAHPTNCAKQISAYSYDLQHAAYTSAVRKLRPELAGREDFVFLFVETEEPYCVTPMRLGGQFRALGQAKWDRAVRKWHDALTADRWPGYADAVIEATPSSWAMAQEAL